MKYSRATIAALCVPLLVVLAACSQAATTTGASGRVFEVDMTDNSFSPSQIRVSKGESVTFRFRNNGAAVHEAVIGDSAMQARHHEEMTASSGSAMNNGSMPGGTTMMTAAGGMGHDNMSSGGSADDDAITVQPGQMQQMTHTFTESGQVLIGCHQPGHWESGMKATVAVT